MLFLFDQDDQVTGRSAPFTGIASSSNAQLHTFLYACRNIDGHGLFSVHSAFSFTGSTFSGYERAFSVTGRTGGNCLHLSQEGIADPAYLAAAATGRAGLNATLVFGAAAAAGGRSEEHSLNSSHQI